MGKIRDITKTVPEVITFKIASPCCFVNQDRKYLHPRIKRYGNNVSLFRKPLELLKNPVGLQLIIT